MGEITPVYPFKKTSLHNTKKAIYKINFLFFKPLASVNEKYGKSKSVIDNSLNLF